MHAGVSVSVCNAIPETRARVKESRAHTHKIATHHDYTHVTARKQ